MHWRIGFWRLSSLANLNVPPCCFLFGHWATQNLLPYGQNACTIGRPSAMFSVPAAVPRVPSRRHTRAVDRWSDQRAPTVSTKGWQDLGITTNAELCQQRADATNSFVWTSSTRGSRRKLCGWKCKCCPAADASSAESGTETAPSNF